ncbi:MAG: hypothetical protein WD226_01095 [Planctomycetota bacterium]
MTHLQRPLLLFLASGVWLTVVAQAHDWLFDASGAKGTRYLALLLALLLAVLVNLAVHEKRAPTA